MKNLILTVLFLSSFYVVAQPSCAWLNSGFCTPDNNSESGSMITKDNYGNVYVAGIYSGTMILGYNSFSSVGKHDIFVAKYNAYGQLQWAKTGGSVNDEVIKGITIDASGNVYVLGDYGCDGYNFAYQDSAVFEDKVIMSNGGSDIFLAKYASDGTLVFLNGYGSNYNDESRSIHCNNAQKIILTGEFSTYGALSTTSGSISFKNITLHANSGHMFMLGMNTDLNPEWGKQYNVSLGGVALDANDNIYITGAFDYSATFGTHTVSSIGSGLVSGDIYVAKFNSSGDNQWVKPIGGINNSASGGSCGGGTWGVIASYSIAVTPSGTVYVAGYYDHCILKITSQVTLPEGYNQLFLAKFNTDGVGKWVKVMNNSYNVQCVRMYADNNDNVYPFGSFMQTTWFGADTITSSGNMDAYIVKYDSVGNVKWVFTIGGNNYESGCDINGSCDGTILYVTGIYKTDVLHCGSQTEYGTGSSGSDIYIARLNQSVTGITSSTLEQDITVYPNPVSDVLYIHSPDKSFTQAELYDIIGNAILTQPLTATTTISTKDVPNGIYFLHLTGSSMAAQKIVVQH